MKKKSQATILVTDDVSNLTDEGRLRSRAVESAAEWLAPGLRARPRLLYVEDFDTYPIGKPLRGPEVRKWMDDKRALLEDAALHIHGQGADAEFARGIPPHEIVRRASRSRGVRLLVQGTQGRRGLGRVLLGSVAEEVIRRAQVPVLTVGPVAQQRALRPGARPRILVATDLGRNSRRAEEYAAALARRLGGRITLIHSVADEAGLVLGSMAQPELAAQMAQVYQRLRSDARKVLAAKAARIRARGIACDLVVDDRAGSPGGAVLRALKAGRHDLIVMGTHGRNLFLKTFFGSATRQVILESPVPVITVKSLG